MPFTEIKIRIIICSNIILANAACQKIAISLRSDSCPQASSFPNKERKHAVCFEHLAKSFRIMITCIVGRQNEGHA